MDRIRMEDVIKEFRRIRENIDMRKKGAKKKMLEWFLALSDEERDLLDRYEYDELSYYLGRVREYRKDRDRRKTERIEKIRKEFLDSLKKDFDPASKEHEAVSRRADALGKLIIIERSSGMNSESAYDWGWEEKWNDAVQIAIVTGKIPEEDRRETKSLADQAFRDGWNAARKELRKKKYALLFI
jgi:hypothetical protein